MPPGDLAVIIPARNEADRIAATVRAARHACRALTSSWWSTTGRPTSTASLAAAAGAHVVRHARNRGKAAAMETGAEAVRLHRGRRGCRRHGSGPRHLLFLDADLADERGHAGPLAEPVRAGTADMTIAVFTTRVRKGGFGIVVSTAGAGIERAIGWRPAQPLNGQRCLTRAAFTAALPLAAGWGVETGMTIDLACARACGSPRWRCRCRTGPPATTGAAQLHRLHQLADVTRALAVRAAGRVQRPCGRNAGDRRAPAGDAIMMR